MGCGASQDADTEEKKKPLSKPTKNTSGPETRGDISSIDLLRQSCLNAHNEKRAKHNAPPLTLSDDLNEMAQKWAEHLGKTGKFEHSKGGTAGENLAAHSHLAIDTGEVITNMWYDEIKLYDFNKQGFSMATGHFTQVVWKSTSEMGVGMAKNEKLGMYVFVANYTPPGNMLGSFEQNVEPAA